MQSDARAPFLFQIFICVITMMARERGHMDTNFDMLRPNQHIVHTFSHDRAPKIAQKQGKTAPNWAICQGGLNWYCIGVESVLTLRQEGA